MYILIQLKKKRSKINLKWVLGLGRWASKVHRKGNFF